MTQAPHSRPDTIISHAEIMERIRLRPSPDHHREILEVWKIHSIAEDGRDIPGLLSTLTEDCVYELVTTGNKWHGHTGAETFYTTLLAAFPDIKFHLTEIVIGPQGVWEEAFVIGTQREDWLDYPATGGLMEFRVSIFFPWDPVKRKFRGEIMYASPARAVVPAQAGARA